MACDLGVSTAGRASPDPSPPTLATSCRPLSPPQLLAPPRGGAAPPAAPAAGPAGAAADKGQREGANQGVEGSSVGASAVQLMRADEGPPRSTPALARKGAPKISFAGRAGGGTPAGRRSLGGTEGWEGEKEEKMRDMAANMTELLADNARLQALITALCRVPDVCVCVCVCVCVFGCMHASVIVCM